MLLLGCFGSVLARFTFLTNVGAFAQAFILVGSNVVIETCRSETVISGSGCRAPSGAVRVTRDSSGTRQSGAWRTDVSAAPTDAPTATVTPSVCGDSVPQGYECMVSSHSQFIVFRLGCLGI